MNREQKLEEAVKALRQHLALFCGPDDKVANALFEHVDAALSAPKAEAVAWLAKWKYKDTSNQKGAFDEQFTDNASTAKVIMITLQRCSEHLDWYYQTPLYTSPVPTDEAVTNDMARQFIEVTSDETAGYTCWFDAVRAGLSAVVTLTDRRANSPVPALTDEAVERAAREFMMLQGAATPPKECARRILLAAFPRKGESDA